MAESSQVQGEIVKQNAVIADRHRNPAETLTVQPQVSYTFAGVCAILALVVFAAMVVILWLDWSALKMA